MTRKEFYEKHKYCPLCGNRGFFSTLTVDIEVNGEYEDTNSIECSCGFKGTWKDLTETPDARKKDV